MSEFRTVRELKEKIRKLSALAEKGATVGERRGAEEAIKRVQEAIAKLEPGAEEEHERPDPFAVPDIYLTDEEKAAVVEVCKKYEEIIRSGMAAGRVLNLEALELQYHSDVFRAIARVRNQAATDRFYKNGRGF